ncbi:MAG: hypothetical protein ACKOAX_14205, partial [Candidatus Kapaibacterium sp.]
MPRTAPSRLTLRTKSRKETTNRSQAKYSREAIADITARNARRRETSENADRPSRGTSSRSENRRAASDRPASKRPAASRTRASDARPTPRTKPGSSSRAASGARSNAENRPQRSSSRFDEREQRRVRGEAR